MYSFWSGNGFENEIDGTKEEARLHVRKQSRKINNRWWLKLKQEFGIDVSCSQLKSPLFAFYMLMFLSPEKKTWLSK